MGGNASSRDGGGVFVDDGTCPFGLTAPPLLGPLANNGGPTQTHALLPGSLAIDAGTNLGCPAIDQRGIARPFDGDGDSIATCDIGAYEVGLPFPFLTVVKSALTIEDPISGMTGPKAIPANTALRILDFDGGNPGPVAFVDGSPASGLTYTFTSLGSITDDLEFSNDGGGDPSFQVIFKVVVL